MVVYYIWVGQIHRIDTTSNSLKTEVTEKLCVLSLLILFVQEQMDEA